MDQRQLALVAIGPADIAMEKVVLQGEWDESPWSQMVEGLEGELQYCEQSVQRGNGVH